MAATSTFALVLAVLLCVQNSLNSILRRHVATVEAGLVDRNELLIATEVIKFAISCWCLDKIEGRNKVTSIIHCIKNGGPMVVVAVLYLLMNIISMMALQYVDASLFTMLAQLKLLTTAMCSVLVLGKKIPEVKWYILTCVATGVAVISVRRDELEQLANKGALASSTGEDSGVSLLGVGLVVLETFMSGFASVYFELYLKKKSGGFSVWARNIQLAFISMPIFIAIMAFSWTNADTSIATPSFPFTAWSFVTVASAFAAAVGGLLVALVTKHADSVYKTLAVAIAVILTQVLEAALEGTTIDRQVGLCSLGVVAGVLAYNRHKDPPTEASAPPSTALDETLAAMPVTAVHVE